MAIKVQKLITQSSLPSGMHYSTADTTQPTIVNTTLGGVTGYFIRHHVTGGGATERSEIDVDSASYFQRLQTMVTLREWYFDAGFPFGATEWQTCQQWKDLGSQSTSPPLALRVTGGSVAFHGSHRGSSPFWDKVIFRPSTQTWYTMATEVFLDGPGKGWCRALMLLNGVWTEVVPKSFPENGTFYTDGGQSNTRFQFGIYNSGQNAATLYTGRVGLATSLSDFGISVGGGPAPLPPMPTGLAASQVSTTKTISVSCSPVSGLIPGDGYQVFRDGVAIAGASAGAELPSPSYVDNDVSLDYGQTHLYQMSAGQVTRYGPRTTPGKNVTLVAPKDTQAPAAPARPSATAVTTTRADLTWAANSETDFATYTLERKTGSGSYSTLASGLETTSYSDTTVASGNTYGYRLRAVDTSGNISVPGQELLVPIVATPSTPTGLTATTPAPRQVSLTWTGSAVAYDVYRNGVLVKSGVPTTSYTETVPPGDYSYTVTAGVPPNASSPSSPVGVSAYGISSIATSIDLGSVRAGATTPLTVTASLTGRGTVTVTDNASWLSVSPSSFTLSDTPTVVTYSGNPTGLAAASYSGIASFTEAQITTPQPPVNTAVPTISGTAQSGQTLTGSVGSWSNTPTSYTKKFYRNSGAAGAWVQVGSTVTSSTTTGTYPPTGADVGFQVRYGVVATNANGSSAESFSSSTATIVAAPTAPVNTGLPTITGTTQSGNTLSATVGTWNDTGSAITGYSSQWQRETSAGSGTYANIGSAIAGTSPTYALTAPDVGLKMRIVPTATNGIGSTAATSAATAVVTSTPPSLTLARYALGLNGTDQKVILANASSTSVEPKTFGALVYLTTIASRTAPYTALGFPAPTHTPARRLVFDSVQDRAGWYDQAVGSRGQSGFPADKWVWLIASRDTLANGGTIRAMFCAMDTGVWSALYSVANTTFTAASTADWVLGGVSDTNITAGWSGRILAAFAANAFYSQAQMQATVSSQSGVFYIDPAVLIAAPSCEHVWSTDDAPASPIQDLKGSANELSRVNSPTTYDAGSAVLPLKVA